MATNFIKVTCFNYCIKETYCSWKTEKIHISKTVFLTLKSFRKLFLRAIRMQVFGNFSLEESLSKTASYKNGIRLKYVLQMQLYILLFYHSLEAGNPKYDNCWNKKFCQLQRFDRK